jgi:hypothetical protein
VYSLQTLRLIFTTARSDSQRSRTRHYGNQKKPGRCGLANKGTGEKETQGLHGWASESSRWHIQTQRYYRQRIQQSILYSHIAAQKIKSDLIQKAKVKKAYAKVKAETQAASQLHESSTSERPDYPENNPASLELHPDRQAMLDERESGGRDHTRAKRTPPRKAKPLQYRAEIEAGNLRRAEFEARKTAREAREKDRKAMAKAKRPGRDGKSKLGRQGTVLLNRVRRLTAEGKL